MTAPDDVGTAEGTPEGTTAGTADGTTANPAGGTAGGTTADPAGTTAGTAEGTTANPAGTAGAAAGVAAGAEGPNGDVTTEARPEAGDDRRIRLRRNPRRRRPTGAAPPLPRSLGRSAAVWLGLLAVFVVALVVLLASPAARRAVDITDAAVLRQIARLRTPWLTTVARGIDRAATGWTMTVLSVGLLVAIMVFRRWRHLFVFLGAIIVMELLGLALYTGFERPRPFDVTAIGRWHGFSSPSPPVVIASAVLMGFAYTMLPQGRPRNIGKAAIGVVLAVLVAVRLYLGVDHPFDDVAALAIGISIPLAAFRLFTPNDVVPVAYGGGKTAHLDVTGRRGEAIRQAVHDQLGLTVLDAKPVGLEGSGGSTPLRLAIAGEGDDGEEVRTYLFAKLFAINHVRSDRLYKIGRRILYGRLEDETRFENVRRLVEYEDYAVRLLRDAGIPTAKPYGIVEITPDREYMLVTSFIEDSVEIGDAEVDDAIIDEGLGLIRRLWNAGLAHRDIKPANLMVADGRVYLIDAAFAQVRPSPWREAVDLGNMMLVLAVRTDADRVYQRALLQFTPDEMGEAFAAARGVASPTQLRSAIKLDGRDLVGDFRRLVPARPHISLQRWSIGRVALATAVALGLLFAANLAVNMFTPSSDIAIDHAPECGTSRLMVLAAQSVPEASQVPCVASLPAGWETHGANVLRGRTTFWLDSDKAGRNAVTVNLLPADRCDVAGASEVPSDEVGTDRFERPTEVDPGLRTTRTYLFDGGCVTYELDFESGAGAELLFDVEQALGFTPRERLVDHVRDLNGLKLCGAGARCVS